MLELYDVLQNGIHAFYTKVVTGRTWGSQIYYLKRIQWVDNNDIKFTTFKCLLVLMLVCVDLFLTEQFDNSLVGSLSNGRILTDLYSHWNCSNILCTI